MQHIQFLIGNHHHLILSRFYSMSGDTPVTPPISIYLKGLAIQS